MSASKIKMNKPDVYMPFNWPDFWQAVEGLSDGVIVAYQRLITKYWFHEHCRGLLNDELFLSRICRMDGKSEWHETKQILFDTGRYMVKEHGLWHQPRARQEWQKAMKIMDNNKLRTAAANAVRWGKKSAPAPKGSK